MISTELPILRLSIDFAKKRLALVEKDKDTVRIIETLHYIGRSSQFIAEYNQSIEYFEKELGLLQKIDLKQKEYENLDSEYYSEIEVYGTTRSKLRHHWSDRESF